MEFVCACATKIAFGIASAIGSSMVEPVRNWLCFSFQHNSNIENLREGLERLQNARGRTEHDINVARNNGQEIEADVNRWLEKVDEIMKKASELLEREEIATSRCPDRLNLMRRHQLSQQAKETLTAVDKLIEEVSKERRVGYRPASQDIVTEDSENYMKFDSRQSIVVELMEALKDTNTNVIGVWGMGGIGKTTLVSEVSRQAEGEKLFSKVATANVGQSPNIIRIQGEIADWIGLELGGETEVGRSKHLVEKLIKDTKILVVLDNIWKSLDLTKIGIPRKGSKVILISRDREVLRRMGIQKDFGLEPLSEEEAWKLVVKTLGNSVEGSEFQEIATELVKKCDRLPVALEAVFKALKDKSIEEWKEALQRWKDTLQRLQTSTPGIPIDVELTIYSCIELSYNQLKRREDKDFFLQCAQMRYHNLQMDLLSNCYGLGLFSGINTLEGARNTVCRLLRCLKDSGLLQDCSAVRGCRQSCDCFHMHDVVRDVARSIASTDHNMIVVRDGDPGREWPAEYVLEGCKALSIDAGDIDKIPSKMEFTELKLFSVTGTSDSLQISNTLFQGMEQLRVLEFVNVELLSVPPSVALLTNLQTLKLIRCELKDVTIIGELKNLAILSLTESNIRELPEEMGSLIHLRLLDLSNNFSLKVIPPDVLPNLVELKELYMRNIRIKWKIEGVNNERNNASLIELKHLLQLATLEIDINDVRYLPNNLLFPKLERFTIRVGDQSCQYEFCEEYEQYEHYETPILVLENISSFHLETMFRNLLNKTKSLLLHNLEGVNCVPHKLDREDLQHLKLLQISRSPKIEHVIDSRMSVIVFPSLETLHLKNLINLEEICHGQLSSKHFDKLKAVDIYRCGRLKYFISLSLSSGLSQLEKLVISNCSTMTTIVVKEEGKIEDGQTTLFPKLRYLTLQNLPNLKSFLSLLNSLATDVGEIISESKLDCFTQILHGKVVFPMLNKLVLKGVWHNQHWAKFSCKLTNTPTTSNFQNLLNLQMRGLDNIKHLFSFSVAKLMVQLESLWIGRCGVLEEILFMEDLGVQEEIILFSRLKRLSLEDLPALKIFCMGSNINFSSLKELRIKDCPIIETFICKPIHLDMTDSKDFKEICARDGLHIVTKPLFNEVVAFPNLEVVEIYNIVELKIIWESQFTVDSFCKLKSMHIISCKSLTSIFQSNMLARFQNLEKLSVKDCGSLEQVLEFQGLNVEGEEVAHEILGQLSSKTFDKLRVIEMIHCNSLKFFISLSVASGLSQVEILKIRDCSNMAAIIVKEEGKIEERRTTVFPNLRHLALKNLPKFKRFLSLQNIFVVDVGEIILEGKLDCYMQILQGEVVFPMLEKLELCMIGLKDIQHKQHRAKSSCKLTNVAMTSNFQNLSNLRLEGLCNIKHLLSFFTAKLMVQLESLSIRRCEVLEEILGEVLEEILGGEEVLFPQLKRLSLKDLPALKRFCVGSTIIFPSLEKLEIANCPRMKTFICRPIHLDMTASKNLKEICAGDDSHTVIEPFFSKVVAFPNLEELKIYNMVELKILWENQFAIDSCCCLESMEITSCKNLTSIFPSNSLAILPSLERLYVVHCDSLEQVFENCGSLEQVFELFGLNVKEKCGAISLQELFLLNLPKLRHVWDMDPHPFFCFQNLKQVLAINCESLKSLFPASMARHLTQLETLVIAKCGVEEIVSGNEAAHAMDRLIFPQVEYLHLEELPRLKWFQQGVHTSEWPELEAIWVEGCPFACAPQTNGGTLEECQHEICNKQLHFLFNKNQEVQVERDFDREGLEKKVIDLLDWVETSHFEDWEEEEDEENESKEKWGMSELEATTSTN